MSCSSVNQQVVRMNVSGGSLPEGFCPGSMQELFDAMVARIIVTPNSVFTSFVTGSVEPSSNVGPWFKDCNTWFVWDDTVGRYVPMTIVGSFQTVELKSTSGTFTVPNFIYKIRAEAWGAGGGSSNDTGSSQSGAGGGGYGFIQRAVVPGQAIAFTIGTGGPGGAAGSAGGSTTILGMTCNGGSAGSPTPGSGGTVTGSDFSVTGGPGALTVGGGGGKGGDSANGGQGGVPDVALGTKCNGTLPGGGGAGGTVSNNSGGNGANGRILIYY